MVGTTDAKPGDEVDAYSDGTAIDNPSKAGSVGLKVFLFSRPEEIAELLPLVAEAHAESPFGIYAFSETKARQRLLESLERRDHQAGFYVKYRGQIVGMAGVAVGPHYLSDEGLVATCLAFFVTSGIRRSLLGARTAAHLLRALRGWGTLKGATLLTIHGTSGHVGRMARGARPIGVNVVIPLVRLSDTAHR